MCRFVLLLSFCLTVVQADPKPKDLKKADFKKFVAIGDSLVAGFENFSLVAPQQVHGFANLLVQQAGGDMTLPLVPCPGLPNVLQLVPPPDFPPTIAPIPGTLPFPRLNPTQQPTNLAVPGQGVVDGLLKTPNFVNPQNAVDLLTNVVLGFPEVLRPHPEFKSQVDTAVSLNPKIVLEWLGGNDALFALLTGDFNLFTPLPVFIAAYNGVLQKLDAGTKADLITANIPDITRTPFFTPVPVAAAVFGIPIGFGPLQGLTANDFLRPGGLFVAKFMLQNGIPGPLPANCPLSIQGLPFNQAPCVLTAAQAASARAVINGYNGVIASESAIFGATMIDAHALLEQLYTQGYTLQNGTHLTLAFLGGLISLDGVHPTNTLYAIVANEFIRVLNAERGANIPPVSVDAVAASDPLISVTAALTQRVCQ